MRNTQFFSEVSAILVREVSFRFLQLALLNGPRTDQHPPSLRPAKEKERKGGFPRENLGMEHDKEYLRECELEQSHELAEGDADQHCISERYSPECGKMKKSQEQRNNPKTLHRH